MNSSTGGARSTGHRLVSWMQWSCAAGAAAFMIGLPVADADAGQAAATFSVNITLRTLPESCSLAASNRSTFVRIACNSAAGVIDMQAPLISLTAQAPLATLSAPTIQATSPAAASDAPPSSGPATAVSALPVFTPSDTEAALELLRGNSSESGREGTSGVDRTLVRPPDRRDGDILRDDGSRNDDQELLRLIVDAGARVQSPSKFAEFTSRTVAVGGMEYVEMTVSW